MNKSKISIVILSFALMMTSLTASAQTGIFRDFINFARADTLVNAETQTVEFGDDRNAGDWPRLWTYSITVDHDSISGANNGNCFLQISNSAPSETAEWLTVATQILDGTSDAFFFEGTLYARRIRLHTVKSGTGRSAISYWAAFKRNQ